MPKYKRIHSYEIEDWVGKPLIPPWIVREWRKKKLPGRPGMMNETHKRNIRRILRIPEGWKMPRCRGLLRDGTRCTNTAGRDTKGDFYGLGWETGTYGCGYCARCMETVHYGRKFWTRIPWCLVIAKLDLKYLQEYYEMSDYNGEVVERQAETAVAAMNARRELDLVYGTLKEFREQLDGMDAPTEYVKGALVPMSTRTRNSQILKFAQVLSKLKLDNLKLDESKYIEADRIIATIPEIKKLVIRGMNKVEELVIRKTVKGEEIGIEESIVDYVWRDIQREWSRIWLRLNGDVKK